MPYLYGIASPEAGPDHTNNEINGIAHHASIMACESWLSASLTIRPFAPWSSRQFMLAASPSVKHASGAFHLQLSHSFLTQLTHLEKHPGSFLRKKQNGELIRRIL